MSTPSPYVPMIDLIPASFRAGQRARRRVRTWASAYLGVATIIGGAYFVVSAGRSQALVERDVLASQLALEWERNKEAQRLLGEIHAVEAAITRYDRLAAPVSASDVVGTLGGLLPKSVSLTALTLTPRSEKVLSKPAANAGAAVSAAKPQSVTLSYLVVEMEGIAPSDSDLAQLVSALEGCGLFGTVGMDFARSATIDGTPGRAFRVSARVDFQRHYTFRPSEIEPDRALAESAAAPAADGEKPAQSVDAGEGADEGVSP
ncbi:MAG: hypothetical protein ACKVZJ_00585 [Phycisphaerales bacterium]